MRFSGSPKPQPESASPALFSLLPRVERCQQWLLKNVFYVSKFAPSQLLLKLSSLWSIDSEIGLGKLLFLGRLLTGDKMAPVVRNLLQIRSQSYFDGTLFLWEFAKYM